MELTQNNEPRERFKFHNTYNITVVEKSPHIDMAYMGIVLFESGYVNEEGKESKLKSIQHSANFLQAALTTYLDFNWKRVPEVVRGPALKQAAEQLLSYIGKLKDGENDSFPSIEERDPEGRVLEWQDAVRTIVSNTTGFEYKTARENDPRKFPNPEDKRGNRLVNVDKDWARFSTSPFPRRMSLKLTPDNSVVYRRHNRLYIAIPVFKGLAETDASRKKLSHRKIFWWHTRTTEFSPMPLWQEKLGKKANLAPNFDTILLPLEYDLQKDGSSNFERTLCNSRSWEICLSTLCERRARSGARSFDGNTLHRFPTYFRSDLAVGFDKPEAEIPQRIIGIHFSHTPVITWVLGDIIDGKPKVLETGSIRGNEILDAGLEAQVRLEEEAGKLRWTGGNQFKGVIAQRTNDLSNMIVNLAISKGAHIALEEIKWVDKRGGGVDLNKRFSMWNYASLTKRIAWLGLEIQKRPKYEGLSASVYAYVSDFLTNMTCPQCGAIWKKGQKKENATTWMENGILNCRNCGHSKPHDDMFKAHVVFVEAAKKVVAMAKRKESE